MSGPYLKKKLRKSRKLENLGIDLAPHITDRWPKHRLVGHMLLESSLKISVVYLEKEPRKSRFPQFVSYGQTDGQAYISNNRAASLLKINNGLNFFSGS